MSEYFKWSSDLNTNIRIIDEQHKKIAYFISALKKSEASSDRSVAKDVIEELVDYTISHFAYEEALMEQAEYAFIKPHKRVHRLFIDKINNYVERFHSGEDITSELSAMLKKWLINHIKNEDRDYVELVLAAQDRLHRAARQGLLSRMVRKLF